ncbi:phage tail protein I [Bacillus sp. JJ1773]|uniref:phage tail protein I n=1 Tax=Bacillus sp. JJ1773 TaxID=3122965 RepID=UPI0030009078
MINIHEISVLDLLPPNLKQDPDLMAAAKSLDTPFAVTVNDVQKCIILPNIDNITDHALLDLLAWETHLDFYDTSLPIEIKRELIKKAPSFHRKKGTPAAVEELVATLFDEGRVEEWFEYGGLPYRFQVVTNNRSVTAERAEEFIKALNSVKRLSAHLERVIIQQKEEMNLYFAGVVHEGDFETIRQVI